MCNAGLRVAEVLNLKVKDIDWMTGKLKVVQGKGKKDRILWLNEDDLELLGRWRGKRKVQSDLLFTTL
jgi:integrase